MTEGTIISWTKKEGEQINPGDVLCEIQTDKAVISFETEESGTLAKILVPSDTKEVKIGTLIALMVEEGEDWKDVEIPTGEAAAAPSPSASKKGDAPSTSAPAKPSGGTAQVGVGPAVKNLLHMYGLQAEAVTATGPHGQLLKGDVLKYVESKNLKPVAVKQVAPPATGAAPAAKPSAAPVKPVSVGEQVFVDIEHTNMRKTIAKRLTQSKSTVPHGYGTVDCDITDVIKLRKKTER
jgi:pyruvate/2-oxoglutarate dehydrogenase complex dihydrolipoamide acyltransferase (E2) component